MRHSFFLFICIGLLAACGGTDTRLTTVGSDNGLNTVESVLPFFNADLQVSGNDAPTPSLDNELAALLSELPADKILTGNPAGGVELVSIKSPLAQLGMKLFYSKSLGGEIDSACVSCHHPVLGGGDNLSLGVGVHAVDAQVVGPGRKHTSGVATVPRNAPTTFNTALHQRSLFWDSRVEQLDGGIRTPDTGFAQPDPEAGDSLLAAQARFPVTSAEEMKTDNAKLSGSNDIVRQHLAARIGGFVDQAGLNSNNWLQEFQRAFGTTESAQSLVTYDNIAKALAAYQASQVFVNTPWNRYLAGQSSAISDNAKRGAKLFFTPKESGGADCLRCHQGDRFTDELHHVVAFPQIGPGKGDGTTADDDFGRERETGDARDRYKFRTPSLLNVEMTAPYGHAGAYNTLHDVVNHYNNPARAIAYFNNTNWCSGLADADVVTCDMRYPNALNNTRAAQQALASQQQQESIEAIELNSRQIDQIVAFLKTLTDPCTRSRDCLSDWIPIADGGPDGNQLNAVDRFGNRL